MDIERNNILKIFSQKCFPMTRFVSSMVCNAKIVVLISQNFAFYRGNEAEFHEKKIFPKNSNFANFRFDC